LWQLAFNLNDPVVGALSVREAIAEALDRHQLVANSAGLSTNVTSAVSNHLFGVGIPGGSSNDARYVAVDDVDAEAALVAQGYSYSSNGLALTPAGVPLVLHLIGPTSSRLVSEIESQIQAELLQVGVETKITSVPISSLVGSILPRGSFQMAIAPFAASSFLSTNQALYVPALDVSPIPAATIPPGTTPPVIVAGNTAGTTASSAAIASSVVSRDVFGLSDPALQPLFAQAETSLSPAAANDLYNAIDIQLWQDLPSVPLVQQSVTTVYNNSLYGLVPADSWPSFMFNAQAWNWTLNPPPTVTTTTNVGPNP
jgi:ABC-type transport system substrate-binding protein